MTRSEADLQDEFLWYKDAIIYEVHVKSFFDSSSDGMGDFRGLLEKLDYLESLGVTAIWLLPFYPSPLKDDGYDIADFFDIHSNYGTLSDFREFLREAHSRGIRVIIELVLNHTSDQHLWFQRARRAKPGSRWKDFYVWSYTPEKYKEARIIFKDFESSNWAWDSVAKAYYWHRFYSHQPDLNYDNPRVHEAIFRVIDFWLEMGVDGLRLDAVPYLYELEGTSCENLPETYKFLEKLRVHVDDKFKDRILLAEANQWPEDAVAYFGEGNRCHMAFHFPLMPRIFMAVQMEDRFPIIDILEQTPSIPESCQWALFLRNHDELTLEMVTDEERDYMFRIYASDPKARLNLGIRRRLAPLLDNDRRKIELMNALLFSFPGTPIIYYGDEIGMGDNYYLGDRNGVRTPMQWNPDRNAGFSKANPQKLHLPLIIDPEYHYEAVNVENQERNLHSLLWWMRRLITVRKRFKAFSRGNLEFLYSDNPKVLSFIRRYQDEDILVVVNLSRFSQAVELNLSNHVGLVPEDVFSKNKFPVIKEPHYMLTLGPYEFYWFLLRKKEKVVSVSQEWIAPKLSVERNWETMLEGKMRRKLEEEILPNYLKNCHWFCGKTLTIQEINILKNIPISEDAGSAHLLLVEVNYTEEAPETYMLPISFSSKDRAKKIIEEFPQSLIAYLLIGDEEGILYDGIYDEEFRRNILLIFSRKKRIKGEWGELVAYTGKMFRKLLNEKCNSLTSRVLKGEPGNTPIIYEDAFFLKLYRKLGAGENPEVETIRFLTEKNRFSHAPRFAGAIEYRPPDAEPIIISLLEEYVPNEGTFWKNSSDTLSQYFERVLSKKAEIQIPQTPPFPSDIELSNIPSLFMELVGGFYLEMISLLGKWTGELHLALSSDSEDPGFAPEPFSALYQRSVYQSMRNQVRRVMQSLDKNMQKLPEKIQKEAAEIRASEKEILSSLKKIFQRMVTAMKIRIHDDYNLSEVLYTGKDLVIIDFEGNPKRPMSERRLKRSPLRDVASMIQSFRHVAYSTLLQHASLRPENISTLEPWIELWYHYVSGVFLRYYLNTVGKAPFVTKDKEELGKLLQAFILEREIYQLGCELNNRLNGIIIPIRGIKHILKSLSGIS